MKVLRKRYNIMITESGLSDHPPYTKKTYLQAIHSIYAAMYIIKKRYPDSKQVMMDVNIANLEKQSVFYSKFQFETEKRNNIIPCIAFLSEVFLMVDE
jgi:hypothetical protein